MKRHLKQVFIAVCLVATGFGVSAEAALITNNVTNWNGVTNTVTGGRWSYLDVGSMDSVSTNVGTLGGHYAWGDGSNNWCVDPNNYNYAWDVQSNGTVVTDGRAMGWAYTVGSTEGGSIEIKGSYSGPVGWAFAIYKTTDTDMGRVDMSNKVPLFSASPADGATAYFDLTTTTFQPGNDIVFVSTGGSQWWIGRTLDATLTTVPEPAALSLLALGGLVLFRRRR